MVRSPQSAVRSPQSAVHSPQSAVRSPQSAVRSPQSTVRSPQSIVYTDRSKNVISVSDISAVNFIVQWKLFAFSTKLSILSRLVYINNVFSPGNSLDKNSRQKGQTK